MNQSSIFKDFTNKYSLSKTLRFELVPEGKTLENMKKNLGYKEGSENDFSTFLKDQNIENAYQVLKPVFDKIHEDFITKSLESDEAKNLDFSLYFDLYKKLIELKKQKASGKDEKEKTKIQNEIEQIYQDNSKSKGKIQSVESELRKKFENIFENQGKDFKDKSKTLIVENGDEDETEDLKDGDKKGFRKLLKAKFLYDYLCNLIESDEARHKEFFENIKDKEGKIISKENIKNSLLEFKGFTTYFGGFELNRLNYYTTKEEKSTAVATRIVSVNLPKFVDNILVFNKRENEYLKACNEPKAVFKNEYFNICLSQKGIEDYNTQISNINYQINLYNQAKISEEKDLPKNKKTFKRLSQFKTLHKQIGCGEKGEFIQKIKGDSDLKNKLKEVKNDTISYFEKVNDFISYLNDHDFQDVFWSDKAINTISSKYFADWQTLKNKLGEAKVLNKNTGENKKEEKYKIPQAIQLKELFEVLNQKDESWENDNEWKKEGIFFKSSIFELGNKLKKLKNENINEFNKNKLENELAIKKLEIIETSESPSKALLEMIFSDIQFFENKFNNLSNIVLGISDFGEDENKQKIKEWLDSVLFINQIIKYWKVKDKFETEGTLEQKLKDILSPENNPTRYYDIVRNYLIRKPQGELNKLKLNFENSTFAQGWDENKEKDNFCIILQDDNLNQYLAILNNKNKSIFDKKQNNSVYVSDNQGWTKMVYKLIPGASKTLPKVFFSKKWTDNNPTPEDIYTIKKDETFKKGDKFNKIDLHKLINFYKENLKKYPIVDESWYSTFDFNFSNTNEYESIDQFYNEVDKQGYKISFTQINKKIIFDFIDSGELYLFKIKNKDFNLDKNKEKISNKNLHTIYWQSIFKDIENKPKLNGEAEIFYRPAMLEKAKKELKAKDKNGNLIKASKKRFDNEKFIFHCPITLNFGAKFTKLNDDINSKIKDKKELCFLGIDRGEKHLAYYSLINQKGEILKQGSFNEINGQNYAKKLEEKAGNRDNARKNWQTIGTIKELKDGYISQVVRKIVDLAIEHNALIVLENLNIGFKRGRQKIEKQVYQKLELALAKKLNFLVDKNVQEGKVSSVTNALQLTPPVNNFGDIEGKSQFGIMLYTKADYTSQTDPVTGWRKSIYLKKGSEDYVKDQILGNKEKNIKPAFDNICFDGKDYCFIYTDKNTSKKWELYSSKDGISLDRYYRELQYENSEKKWTPKKQNIVEILDGLFEGFDKTKSLLEQLKTKNPNKINEHTAWESLRFTIDLIQQIRNTGNSERDEDFILSPVRDENGNHFDSRIYWDKEKSNKEVVNLPVSGDANGAYNIARKGIMMNGRIKNNLSLFIRDDEWDKFAQSQK